MAPSGNQTETEKTNIALKPRARRTQKAGKQSPPESEGKQGHEMAYETEWGRVRKAKQGELPYKANDCCGAMDWKHHPAWTEAMRAALEKRRENGGKWYSLIGRMYDPRQLWAAWKRIDQRTKGEARHRGAGVDGATVEEFSKRAEQEVARLAEELKTETYRPKPVKRHWINKPGTTKKRPLGLPSVRDKVVQEALRSLIEPIFECEFKDGSHGFRPKRSTETACQRLEANLGAGKSWIVDADIAGFFDNIDHEKLLTEVNRRIADGKVLKLIRTFLEAGVMEEMKVRYATTGTPQGGIISPLLANIYLHALDERFEAAGIAWVRYADDFLLLSETRAEAEAALKVTRDVLEAHGLNLSPEKTSIVHLEEGFDFVGWHYRGRQRWPRHKSVKALRVKLSEKTRRARPGSMEMICGELTPILRGWFNYFRDGNSGQIFPDISGWLRRRLRSIIQRRHSGRGIAKANMNSKWPNRCFAGWGLFDLEVELKRYRHSHS